MACVMKNCNIISDEERMITCWLCHSLCHFKCSGLPVLVAESIFKFNGLSWCCNDCRKIGVSFYRFFQGTKARFLELQEEAIKLSEKISNYGKLFDDFKSLDNLKSPVQSSPKRRKSARKNNKEKQNDPPVDVADSIGRPYQNKNNAAASYVNTTVINNSASTILQNPGGTISDAHLNVNPKSSVDVSSAPDSVPNQQNLKYVDVAINNENNSDVSRELRVIPPKKHIFISRFASDTSAEDIDFYIKSKLGNNVDTAVRKFKYLQERSITSFKITVPFNIFNTIVNPLFWPNHVLVREYEFNMNRHPNNIAYLPAQQLTTQKN